MTIHEVFFINKICNIHPENNRYYDSKWLAKLFWDGNSLNFFELIT